MAQATLTKDEVLGFLKSNATEVSELRKVVDELLSKAKQSGSRVGGDAKDFLLGNMKDGVAFFGQNGQPLNQRWLRKGRRRNKSYNIEMEREDGKRGSFGEWITNLTKAADLRRDNDERAKALTVCKSYRTQQYRKPIAADTYGADEYIAKTALAESSAITGGYTLVPTEFSNQLYEIPIEESIVEKRAYQQPLVTRQCTIPALDQVNETFQPVAGQSNLLAGMNLYWTAEAAMRKESEPSFRNVVGTAWEGSFYALVSNNLLADNATGLEAFLPDLFRKVVGWGRDYAFLQGNGVGQPLGMLNTNAAIQVDRAVANAVTYTDICNLEAKLYTLTRHSDDIAWIIHPTVKPYLTAMNDLSGYYESGGFPVYGRLVFQPNDQGAQAEIDAPEGIMSYGSLLGYPVFVTEKVPALGSTGDLGLYDMSAYCVFQRMEIEIMVSNVVEMLTNQTAYRVVTRVDGQPLLGNHITYADDGANSTASPFVLLSASA